MNVNNKNFQMKKIISANKVFICLQIGFFILSIVFNFILSDIAVFLTVFTHIAIYVIYNIITESVVEYGYLRKKYEKIVAETNRLRYLQLKNRMYKTAKQKQDIISYTLISQSAVKILIAVLNIILMAVVVTFE